VPLVLAVVLAACVPATGSAGQLITVDAASARSTTAVVRLWSRDGDCWRPIAGPWWAHVGRIGIAATRREGDGTTPAGTFTLGRTIYGTAADPGVAYTYHRLVCGDWWDEDPDSPSYNRFRHISCDTRPPFAARSDPLWQSRNAYRHFAVIAYNVNPTVPGRGSGIFFHADIGIPTSGCVSLPRARPVALLRWLDPDLDPVVAIGVRGKDGHPVSATMPA
jgi:L,D-peptidoglycan transpeptidase YkuD (ErfK/YbiS/YcfS/YnhG family)